MDNRDFETWFAERNIPEQEYIKECMRETWQAALSRSQDAPRCQCCGYLVTESEHRGCLRSAERSQDVARVADEATFQRLFIKHGGPVDGEGWCVNESGLRDFLRELAAAPAAPAVAPIYQIMCTDDDDAEEHPHVRDLWMDVPKDAFDKLAKRGDMRTRAVYAAPAPAEPKGEQQDDYEAKGTIEHLDLDNHRLRRAMQKIMARLAELLDEDQFANIESIVKGVGVEPPEQRVAPIGKVLSDAEMFDAKMDGKSGNVIWFNAPKPGFIYAAPAEQRAGTLSRDAFYSVVRAALKEHRRNNPPRYLNDEQANASDSEFATELADCHARISSQRGQAC
jgi:hypothetical protein